MKIEESLNVTFDETPPPSKTSSLVDDDLDEDDAVKVAEKKVLDTDIDDETLEVDEVVNIKESKNHPLSNVTGNLNQRTLSWIIAMQEELNQFIANDVWELVPHPKSTKIIGTKWENGIVSHNKVLYDHVMYPLTTHQEQKTRKDYGTKRGRPSTSTSSSSAFGQPSSSHHIDDDNDGNKEGTSHAITPSLTRFVNSLSNDIPQVFSNPPNIDPNMEAFYTRQTEILNGQFQLRDEKRGGLRSIGKGIKNLLRGKKK
ncbi:hypothetical protein Tco_0115842 [Tanacetum coccineum]